MTRFSIFFTPIHFSLVKKVLSVFVTQFFVTKINLSKWFFSAYFEEYDVMRVGDVYEVLRDPIYKGGTERGKRMVSTQRKRMSTCE